MASREEKWIMVVDDSPDMRELLVFMLRQLGWKRVLRAVSGKSALAQLSAKPELFCLVLVDWEMPDMNGVELLEAVRTDDSLKQLPILMVTANSQENQVRQAIDLGIAGYLIKPLSIDILGRKIEQILARPAPASAAVTIPEQQPEANTSL